MDYVNVNAKNIPAATQAAAIAAGQKIKSGSGTAFADLLTFSGNSLSTALNANSAHPAEHPVQDTHNETDFDHQHDHEHPEKSADAHNDDHASDRTERHDPRDDDTVRADHDDHDNSDHQDAREPETAENETSNDDQNLSEDTSQDQDQPKEAASEDGTEDNSETAQGQSETEGDTTQGAGEGENAQTMGPTTAQQTNQAVDPMVVAAAQNTGGQHNQTQTQMLGEDGLVVDPNAAQKQASATTAGQNNAQNGLLNQNGAQQAQGQKNAQNGLNQAQTVDPELQGEVASAVQKQAGDLSKKLGQNQQVQINVKLGDAAQTTTSQPSATLTNAAAVAAQASATKNNAGNQNSQNGNGQANMGQNAQAAMMNAQAQNNQQVQQQNAQNQNFQTMVSDSKAVQQAGVQKGQMAQTVQTGGGETAQLGNTQNSQNTAQAQQAAQQKPAHQAKHTYTAQARMDQINVEINKGIKAGADKINIQLRPAELGRIEIQLEMNNGRINAVVTADRPETLEMLKNDAKDLQKAMREAGLDLGDMNFNLNQQNNESQQTADQGRSGPGGSASGEEDMPLRGEDIAEIEREAQEMRSLMRAAYGGVDVSA